MEKRTIKDVANEYALGFLTYKELVEEISKCNQEEDGQIIADAINEVKETDEYYELEREFAHKLGELYKESHKINDIARYHIRKAYIES